MTANSDGLDPVEVAAALVSIPSVNPALVPNAHGEAEIADWCGAWLLERGFEVHRLEARAGRPSIVGIARGTGGGRSLMLNGHYDTVTLVGYDGDPLQPRLQDGKLSGRGSFDMKSGLAGAMVAAARATRHELRGDVLVACVADEEHSSLGTEEVLAAFTADAGIVTEPSHLQLTLTHKGFVWFDVVILGRAAHGSRPELGIDAIEGGVLPGRHRAMGAASGSWTYPSDAGDRNRPCIDHPWRRGGVQLPGGMHRHHRAPDDSR